MMPKLSNSQQSALILDLYLAARKLPQPEQQAFVETQTGDSDVRQQVLSFLQAKKVTLQNGTLRLGIDTLSGGDKIAGRYEVIHQIDKGGMGVVYAVLDLTMGEKRALKVIRPEFAASEDTRLRFIQEVRLAQRVAHPNVCRIFDIGFDPPPNVPVEEESDRLIFFTMELLQGQTLANRIAKHPLDVAMAVGIIRQVAAALKAAHDHDVIHRDLKPANIMLVPERDASVRAVVMDFGMARGQHEQAEARLTQAGFIVGTPAYMAPEQMLGQSTPASDVYALGVVLYEMLTGTLPFKAGSNPGPHFREFDPSLERVILKCISTDAARRYQNPSELIMELASENASGLADAPPVTDLDNLATRIQPSVTGTTNKRLAALLRRRNLLIAGATFASAGSLPFVLRFSGKDTSYVAVLPFRVVGESSNADLLAVGLTDSLSARLFQWQNVRMPSSAAVERVGNFPMKRVARELGAKLIVHGTIQTDGGQVQVSLMIEDVEDDRVLAREVVSGTRSQYFELQNQVYSIAVRALHLQERADAPREPVKVASTNPEATDLYWKARQSMSQQRNAEDVKQAIRLYEQSVRLDPAFARAWAYLSDAYVVLYRSSRESIDADRAVSAAEQACRLDNALADAHFALGYAQSLKGQTSTAINETRRALELAPNSAEGYRRLGRIYQDSGAKDASIAAFRRAVELNPHYWNTHLQFAAAYFRYGENQNAALHYQRVTEQVPERAEGYQGLATAYLQMGDFARSESAYKKALTIQERPTILSGLATVYCFQGQYTEGIRILQKAIELAPNQEIYHGNLGDAYRWSGKVEEARAAYQKAMSLAHADLSTNPRSASSLGSLALYCAKLGEIDQGLDYIQRARGIDPSNIGLQYNEAIVRALAGQSKQAVAALEQAVKGGRSWKFAAADPDLRLLRNEPQFRGLADTERARRSP